MRNDSAGVDITRVLREIIGQSESSGSEAARNQLLSSSFPLKARTSLRAQPRLRCTMGQEVAVNCAIPSRCFSSELRVATLLAELGFRDRKQPLEDIAAGLRFEMSERAFDFNICELGAR